MIYLDNAATTGRKPMGVIRAVNEALTDFSVNPGRGGYERSARCSEKIFEIRKKVCDFFNCDDETQVVFTANCTESANIVLKGILNSGDHLIVSSIEHNAVSRPAFSLSRYGIETDYAEVIFDDDDATVRSFQRRIKDNTKLVVCTHASNVTGHVMPIEKIGKLCREKGILFAVDCAQTAGILPIDMQKQNIDFLFVAPHKGLYAPMGTGILIARQLVPKTIIEGGTGTESMNLSQPSDMPERLESGTLNVPGIMGIGAGIDFINRKGMKNIYSHEMMLAERFYSGLGRIGGITVYSPYPETGKTVPTISFNINGIPSTETAEILGKNGIAVRAGLHCAPLIHKRVGTLDTGSVRVCFSAFNRTDEVDRTLFVIKNINK